MNMKNQKITIIILSVVLVLLIAVSVWAYGSFSEDYVTNETADVTTTADDTKEIVTTTDFTMTDKSGNTVKLSDYFGKPIVVNFWASWCSPCKSEMPHFEEAYKEYGSDMHFIMVNVGDSHSEAYEFADKSGYTFPVYHDSNYSGTYAYGVSSIPQTLFINSDGELVNSYTGMMSKAALQSNIEKIK